MMNRSVVSMNWCETAKNKIDTYLDNKRTALKGGDRRGQTTSQII